MTGTQHVSFKHLNLFGIGYLTSLPHVFLDIVIVHHELLIICLPWVRTAFHLWLFILLQNIKLLIIILLSHLRVDILLLFYGIVNRVAFLDNQHLVLLVDLQAVIRSHFLNLLFEALYAPTIIVCFAFLLILWKVLVLDGL